MTAKSLARKVAHSTESPSLIELGDFLIIFGLSIFALFVSVTPERHWRRIGRVFSSGAAWFGLSEDGNLRSRLAAVFEDRLPGAIPRILRDNFAHHIERNLQVVRDRLPFGWRPQTRVVGAEHIDAALATGNGVVLWDSHFAFSTLVTKIGLWRAGYQVSHLSHPRHGFSSTRFGMRYLNPIRAETEARYLRERVVLDPDNPKGALQRLDTRLAQNGIVSVTVRADSRRPTKVPFFGGEILLAPGAPSLAYKRQAALLPVFTLRDSNNVFHVHVETPIRPHAEETRDAFFDRAYRTYAAHLERYVARDPGQWLGWLDY